MDPRFAYSAEAAAKAGHGDDTKRIMFKLLKKQIPVWVILSLLLVSLFGFLDAGYLTVKHFQGEVPACSIVEGCEIVTTSVYSEIFGFPVAGIGVLYYLFIFVLSLVYFDTRNEKIMKYLPYLTGLGLIASLYFIFLQIFILKAICLYCMGSALTSTLLFILGIISLRYKP